MSTFTTVHCLHVYFPDYAGYKFQVEFLKSNQSAMVYIEHDEMPAEIWLHWCLRNRAEGHAQHICKVVDKFQTGDVRFVLQLGQIGTKWDKSGTF